MTFIFIFNCSKDFAGSSIVHGLGGICGVCASAVLGKRKLQADIVDIGSIPPSAPALVTLGKSTIYAPYIIVSQPVLYLIENAYYLTNIWIRHLYTKQKVMEK